MKKVFFTLIVLLVFGLVIGCSTTPPVLPTLESFAGTWRHGNPAASNDTITITGNTFTKQWEAVGNGSAGSKTGTFVFDAKTITFTTTANEVWKTAYKLTDEYLELTTATPTTGYIDYSWHWYGRFDKR